MSQKITEKPKHCKRCGSEMHRKRYRGVLEGMAAWRKRRFCSQRCANGGSSKRIKEKAKRCKWCGHQMHRKRYGEKLESMSVWKKRKFCSLSCANSRKDVGRQGWLSRARKLRGPACDGCQRATRLQVHHADGNMTNLKPENLQTLCITCHKFLHDTAKRLGLTVPGKLASPVLLPK